MIRVNQDTHKIQETIRYLGRFADGFEKAIKTGLKKAVKGIHNSAFDWLNGAKGAPGSFPVPARTSNLKNHLDFLFPGKSKSAGFETFSAGEFEAMNFNSARYADVIKDGTHSSAKYGDRNFLDAGLNDFGGAGMAAEYLLTEINNLIRI